MPLLLAKAELRWLATQRGNFGLLLEINPYARCGANDCAETPTEHRRNPSGCTMNQRRPFQLRTRKSASSFTIRMVSRQSAGFLVGHSDESERFQTNSRGRSCGVIRLPQGSPRLLILLVSAAAT
jgi:hypothetical protein